MLGRIRSYIEGGFLEKPARFVWRLLRGRDPRDSEWTIRLRRDEANVQRLLRDVLRPESCCVDIGAHTGVFLGQFLELSPQGRHHAFEPLPHLAEQLAERHPTVRVHALALSNTEERCSFMHVRELPAWSGLRKQKYPDETAVEEIEVQTRRLDSLLEPSARVDFVKIDVEGAELGVLQGAEATLRRCRPVVLFEHASIHNQEYETTPDMVHDLLVGRCGLRIFSLDGRGPHSRERFREIYERSATSNYDRRAETNFVARP